MPAQCQIYILSDCLVNNDPDITVKMCSFGAIARFWSQNTPILAELHKRIASLSNPKDRADSLNRIFREINNAEYQNQIGALYNIFVDCLINDSSPSVRLQILQLVAREYLYLLMHHSGARERLQSYTRLLLDRAEKDPDERIRVLSIYCALQNENQTALKTTKKLYSFLTSKAVDGVDPMTRAAACQAIAKGWRHDENSLDFLIACAEADDNPETRIFIYRSIALSFFENNAATEFLKDCIHKEDNTRIVETIDFILENPTAGKYYTPYFSIEF